jgi:flagellar basal-body rod protein FlgC
MGFFKSMDISASALTAQRFRMDVIAENIANAQTTRTASGQPYRRKITLMGQREPQIPFSERLKSARQAVGNGVRVTAVIEDEIPLNPVYDPNHPDADEKGYVHIQNVNTVVEMIDLMSATRSYEANVTVVNAFKNMAMKALEIGR